MNCGIEKIDSSCENCGVDVSDNQLRLLDCFIQGVLSKLEVCKHCYKEGLKKMRGNKKNAI